MLHSQDKWRCYPGHCRNAIMSSFVTAASRANQRACGSALGLSELTRFDKMAEFDSVPGQHPCNSSRCLLRINDVAQVTSAICDMTSQSESLHPPWSEAREGESPTSDPRPLPSPISIPVAGSTRYQTAASRSRLGIPRST